MNGPGSVRKASPLICGVDGDRAVEALGGGLAPRRRTSRPAPAPVWFGLKRMLSRAVATAGITLVAGLATSMVVISRFEGWNSG